MTSTKRSPGGSGSCLRDGGRFGVVLPRSALAAKGCAPWRHEILGAGEFTDVTTLLNSGGWVIRRRRAAIHDRAGHRPVKGRVAGPQVRLRGPYASRALFDTGVKQQPAELDATAFGEWSEGASFPLLPTADSVRVFLKLRAHPRLDRGNGWFARPYRELHATNDKRHLLLDPPSTESLWPVYAGSRSFDIWEPDTGEYYAWADPELHHRCAAGKATARTLGFRRLRT